jgi:hypothetical protein
MTENQNDQSTGGAGDEGTIPESDTGLAVNVADGSGTTFEPEEDPSGAESTGGEDADGKPRPDSHNAETNEDTVSGGPA